MLGLLIIVIAFGIGVGTGYGWREMISRRRRRIARGDLPPRQREPQQREPEALVADSDSADSINLDRLLIAANDDLSGRRRLQPQGGQQGGQQVDLTGQSDEYDGTIRNLLGELNRRPSEPSSAPRHQTVDLTPKARPRL